MKVPGPASSPFHPLFETIRFEEGQWPLWRMDRNLRYITKSLVHRTTPWTVADQEGWQAARDYLAGGTWRRSPSRSSAWLLGGDAMWIRSGWETALSPGITDLLRRSDLAVFNLETPVDPASPVETWTYETLRYNAPPAYLLPWKAAPRGVASLCNNHALDQGLEGLGRTREAVQAAGLVPVGGLVADEAVSSVDVGALRCGFVGWTYDVNRPPAPIPPGIPVIRFGAGEPDWALAAALIAKARAQGPDLVVVLAHWGFEYECWPTTQAREQAHRLIALGADVIVGSSPHVLQPVEVVSVDGGDPDCPVQVRRSPEGAPGFALVVWSLGNLCSIMPTLRCQVGALLAVGLGKDEGVAFSSLNAIPTVTGRGLGDRWIDARTVTLEEHGRGHDVRAHREIAEAALWPLVT